MMHNGYDGGGGQWLFMAVLMFLFWSAVIAGIVWLVRHTAAQTPLAPQGPQGAAPVTGPSDGARRILDERLARGEIDADEYRARRAALEER